MMGKRVQSSEILAAGIGAPLRSSVEQSVAGAHY